MSRADADYIRRQLDDRIEQVLDALNPGWERRGDTAYLTPKSKKDLGSFTVSLGGRSKMPRGCWHRFSQSIGGGSVELVAYLETGRRDAYREAFKWAKAFLGIEDTREAPEAAAEREERRRREEEARKERARQAEAEKAQKDAKRTQSAAEAWKGTKPLGGSLGDAYLVERGIPPVSEWPWNPDGVLRFHPALDFEPNRDVGLFPAVVGKVSDQWGESTGIWQIYIARGEPRKADLHPSPKIGRGPAAGGAVRLGGIGSWIGVAEGIESALAAWFLWDCKRPVWACLSTSGMSAFDPPMEIERITIFPDGDQGLVQGERILDPPGITAARKLQERMKKAGIRCDVSQMCVLGDALDLLRVKRKHEQKNRDASPLRERSGRADRHWEGAVG